ncbi:hypothetical protein M569_00205, partial [Genlisea aurea]
EQKRNLSSPRVIQHSDPLAVNCLLKELDSGKYGTKSKEIEELVGQRSRLLSTLYSINPKLPSARFDVQNQNSLEVAETDPEDMVIDEGCETNPLAIVTFDPASLQSQSTGNVIVIDSDDDNDSKSNDYRSVVPCNAGEAKTTAAKPTAKSTTKPTTHLTAKLTAKSTTKPTTHLTAKLTVKSTEPTPDEDKGEYVGADDDMQEESDELSDDLGDIWNEMKVALECSKEAGSDTQVGDYDPGYEEDCEHSFILKDDIGDVCRICGVIGRGIESIIEYNFSKGTRSTRTYSKYESRVARELDGTEIDVDGLKSFDSDFDAAEIYPHPRHRKEMKPHQIDGFNFLVSNLVAENPGGCIMAHAPGSGKTFMIISFLQSFMAKYPGGRPLVVLPRGILPIWKKEFIRWQVEHIPLYDFYSVKADSRLQQLEVLKEWVKERSILFLGYKQFSSIICDTDDGQAAVACQNYLLKVPTILILDEGHTPRNQDTDVLTSLERVETARKVVLSGTLYQNHVEEVFNILNLVRPKFLKMDIPKSIKRRILSRAEISCRKKMTKQKRGRENQFYELIEHTLIRDENKMRKVTVIEDLREMTKKVLHYYRGDNLDELPGLVDFSVFLELSPMQKSHVKELTRKVVRKFTVSAQGSAIYLHPSLKSLAEQCGVKDRVDEEKINGVLEGLDVSEGAKLKFYLDLLQLCEWSGEKLLVFSQYLLPLKFLERVTGKLKGYSVGREMFMITGESDTEWREWAMEKFNTSGDARVFFGSIRACGEGVSLVGASRIVILDVHLNPSVTRQAIGRAFRPGQVRKVYTYRLVASESPEEEDHMTCFRKESIAKMWFECSGHENFEMHTLDLPTCGDPFLETPPLNQRVNALFRR